MDRLIEQVRVVLACAEDAARPADSADLRMPISAAAQHPPVSTERAPMTRRSHADTMPMSPTALRGLTDWRYACELSELPEGAMHAFAIDGRELLFARRAGTITCFTNACAGLGCAAVDDVSTCPHHGLQYHLVASGYLIEPAAALLIHPTRVIGTHVEVRLR